jgi:hypothetical protein
VKDDTRPLWNEQYTWDVHEPSTVLTIGVFDNQHTRNSALEKARSYKDKPMGKVGGPRHRSKAVRKGRAISLSYNKTRLRLVELPKVGLGGAI